jgi:hypothetical protein
MQVVGVETARAVSGAVVVRNIEQQIHNGGAAQNLGRYHESSVEVTPLMETREIGELDPAQALHESAARAVQARNLQGKQDNKISGGVQVHAGGAVCNLRSGNAKSTSSAI